MDHTLVTFDSCGHYEQTKSDAHDLKQIFAHLFSLQSCINAPEW